jgi:hypothetical protein
MTLRQKLVMGVVTAAVSVIGLGGTAFADHAHFVVITHPKSGETTCQYVAAGRSEPAPNHPLHNNVHMGQPGSDAHGSDFDKEANQSARCNNVRRK